MSVFYLIVAGVLLALLALSAAAAFLTRRESDNNRVFASVPISILIVLTLFTLALSVTTVDARAIAIKTGFGRYTGTLDNGFHLKAPWEHTEEFTTRLQTGDLEGHEGTPVTFAGGGSGRVDSTFRWAIKDDTSTNGARLLWAKYKDFDTVQSTLVMREARDAILNTVNDYTPNAARTAQDDIGVKVKDRLQQRLAPYGITVDSVSVLGMALDARTQASLDKIVAAQNDVERAKADNQRARIDNETAQLRARSGALSAPNLQRYCLDVVNNWDVQRNGALPATFNCGMTAGGTPVIVGTK